MKKAIYLIGIMLLIVSLVGCNSEEASQDDLQYEFSQLEEKYELLVTENTSLEEENEILNQTVLSMSKDYDKVNDLGTLLYVSQEKNKEIKLYREELERFAKYLENHGTDSTETIELLNLYNPDWVKVGDEIADLKVSKVNISNNEAGSRSEHVEFKGDFTVTGTLESSDLFGKYLFVVDKKDMHLIPYTSNQMDYVMFVIENEKELEKALGDKLENFDHTSSIKIKAQFTDYTYDAVFESELRATAKIKNLLAVEEQF